MAADGQSAAPSKETGRGRLGGGGGQMERIGGEREETRRNEERKELQDVASAPSAVVEVACLDANSHLTKLWSKCVCVCVACRPLCVWRDHRWKQRQRRLSALLHQFYSSSKFKDFSVYLLEMQTTVYTEFMFRNLTSAKEITRLYSSSSWEKQKTKQQPCFWFNTIRQNSPVNIMQRQTATWQREV